MPPKRQRNSEPAQNWNAARAAPLAPAPAVAAAQGTGAVPPTNLQSNGAPMPRVARMTASQPDPFLTDPPPPQSSAASTASTGGKRGAGNRRLLDKQNGAEKVQFDDTQDPQQQQQQQPATPQRGRGRKRKEPPAAADDQLVQDADARIDPRLSGVTAIAPAPTPAGPSAVPDPAPAPSPAPRKKAARGKKEAVAAPDPAPAPVSDLPVPDSQQPPDAEVSTGNAPEADGVGDADGDFVPDTSVNDTPPVQGGILSPTGRLSGADYLDQVQMQARANVAAAGKKPQRRVQWSVDETEALLNYIVQIGCSWAAIKNADQTEGGDVLARRHQGDIKDKARNIKFDYIKARKPLPPNFDKIVLARAMVQKLEEMGIDYEHVRVRKPRS